MTRRGRIVLGWAAALLVAALFARLGFWQAGRAVEKQRTLDAVATVLRTPTPGPLDAAADPRHARDYAWAQGRGRFTGPPLWHDNQQRDGRVGVRGYAPFRTVGGTYLLVDVGWEAIAADRRQLPAVRLPTGDVEVRGLLVPPPSAGLAMGAPMARHDGRWLMLRVEPGAIARELRLPGPLAPRVLRLDPALPFGLPRDLAMLANTLTPDKHRGYSLQWFGLAATVLVIALVLTFRGFRR